MRCVAHILIVVVNDGLSEVETAILKVRVVIIARPSRQRYKFKACIIEQNLTYKVRISLDIETRWNFIYITWLNYTDI